MLFIGQLPPLLVCDVACDDEVPEEVLALDVFEAPLVVAVVAEVESSDSPESPDDAAVLVLVELAATVWVVVAACPSCQARTPPSDSIAATLSAVAALRARAARGLRLGRAAPARGRGLGAGESTDSAEVEVGCSSMTVKVRTGGERAARDG
jgi:hypothetical protein